MTSVQIGTFFVGSRVWLYVVGEQPLEPSSPLLSAGTVDNVMGGYYGDIYMSFTSMTLARLHEPRIKYEKLYGQVIAKGTFAQNVSKDD